jgi:hypothetical protein
MVSRNSVGIKGAWAGSDEVSDFGASNDSPLKARFLI